MDKDSFYLYLSYVTMLVALPTFMIGLLRIKNIKGYLLPLFIYVSISILAEILNFICSETNTNNMFVFHFYTFFEFILISFFYHLFFKNQLKTGYFLFPIPVFLLVAFIDYKINGLTSMDNFALSIESIVLSLYALISFLYIMRKLLFENILSEPFFWVNFGVLFYFSGNLLVFAFHNYVTSYQPSYENALWAIPQLLNIFYNILICIGFWKARTN